MLFRSAYTGRDGLGDTIRVSLTEEPEYEMPVAKKLVKRYSNRSNHDEIETISINKINPFKYNLRETRKVLNVGGENVLCGYPDEQHPVNYEVNWLAVHEQSELVPAQFALHQNFPNPFNPTTTFRFDLPGESEVRLAVYDMLGREVALLLRDNLPAGTHSVNWAGLNDKGTPVSTGIYYVKFVADEFLETRKVTLLK